MVGLFVAGTHGAGYAVVRQRRLSRHAPGFRGTHFASVAEQPVVAFRIIGEVDTFAGLGTSVDCTLDSVLAVFGGSGFAHPISAHAVGGTGISIIARVVAEIRVVTPVCRITMVFGAIIAVVTCQGASLADSLLRAGVLCRARVLVVTDGSGRHKLMLAPAAGFFRSLLAPIGRAGVAVIAEFLLVDLCSLAFPVDTYVVSRTRISVAAGYVRQGFERTIAALMVAAV